jgi:hypothetical protein
MISTIEVSEIVRTFKPLDVASYLRLHGWTQQEIVPEKYAIWTKGNGDRDGFEVLLPLAAHFRDFASRVADLINTLQAVEKRALPEILEDLTTPHADIVRARLAPDGDMNGSLPLEDGASVFQQMRDLVLAAACAAISPRHVYAKRKPDQAMNYLREARFGQTKRGSYVITVLSPVPPILANGQQRLAPEFEDEPFSRKTIRLLADALAATEDGVQEVAASGRLDVFAAAVERGVSANLCEAIIKLNKGAGDRGVEFSFAWAPSRGEPQGVRNLHRLMPDSMPYLEEVSRYFRQTSELDEVEVFGVVHKLELTDLPDVEKVTIVGTADGERRSVLTELGGDLRKLVIRAHEDRIPVALVGELTKEGKSYRLRNPRDFRLVEEAD